MANLFSSENYPTSEPSELIAGDRWTWKRTDLGDDYDPDSYSLSYACRLEGDGYDKIEITASESGTEYVVEVASSTTTNYTAGQYHWQAYITRTSDSERILVDSGTFEVKANRDASSADPRSHVKKTLDLLETLIEGKANKDQVSYSVGGVSVSKMSWAEIMEAHQRYTALYAQEVRQERIKNGLGHSGRILVRFS